MVCVGRSGAAPPMLGWAVEREIRVLIQSSPVDCFRRAKYCNWKKGGGEDRRRRGKRRQRRRGGRRRKGEEGRGGRREEGRGGRRGEGGGERREEGRGRRGEGGGERERRGDEEMNVEWFTRKVYIYVVGTCLVPPHQTPPTSPCNTTFTKLFPPHQTPPTFRLFSDTLLKTLTS